MRKNLLPIEKFYSQLHEEEISKEDYLHAQKVWETFKCKTLKDYQEIYLKLDCCLLSDVFEEFREQIYLHYQLDPAHYLTVPSLAMDCALKFTKLELELITDLEIYNFLEKGIRGGVSMVVKRYAEANNKYLKDFDPEKVSSYLLYLDANNLYGKAMSLPLPVSDFKFVFDREKGYGDSDWKKYGDCIIDCDISCPREIHEKFKDFPLFPEHKNGKLKNTFYPKENYVTHSRYLKDCLSRGYVLERVNKILSFKSKAWLKPYIEKNTKLREKASSKFEQDYGNS